MLIFLEKNAAASHKSLINIEKQGSQKRSLRNTGEYFRRL
jgi:hypothetical protein